MLPDALRDRFLVFLVLLNSMYPITAFANKIIDPKAASKKAHRTPRFFIRVELSPSFPAREADILTVVQENLPVDILRKRGLVYEDPSAYLDLQKWNPNNAELRETAEMKRRFTQLNMQMMLTISISLLGDKDKNTTFLLTGKLTNLKEMSDILSVCLEKGNLNAKSGVDCPDDGNAFRATSVASVELQSISALRSSLRILFEKLLHIPKIEFETRTPIMNLYALNEDVSFDVRVHKNEGDTFVNQSSPRLYNYSVKILQIDKAYAQQICKEPELLWDQLECDADGDPKCQKYLFGIVTRIKSTQTRILSFEGKREIGLASVKFRAPPYQSKVLVRVEVEALEFNEASDRSQDAVRIRSNPLFRCLDVQAKNLSFLFNVRFSPGIGASVMNSSGADVPWVDGPDGRVGLDIGVNYRFFDYRALSSWNTVIGGFANARFLLGYSAMSIKLPCPSLNSDDCMFHDMEKTIDSNALDMKVQLDFGVRLWRLELSLLAEAGISGDAFSSTFTNVSAHLPQVDQLTSDGWHGFGLYGWGARLAIDLTAVTAWVDFVLENRQAFSSIPIGNLGMEPIGILDSRSAFWISLGGSFNTLNGRHHL